jgi:hypothetical protein
MFDPHQARYCSSQTSLARIATMGDHPMPKLSLIPLVNGVCISPVVTVRFRPLTADALCRLADSPQRRGSVGLPDQEAERADP